MSLKRWSEDIISRYFRLSETETKILGTILLKKRSNIYGLWKASRMKHYATVLRTVKKLEKKGLVEVLSEKGTRGEKIFSRTLIGILVYDIVKGEEKKIVKIVTDNSRLFRELSKTEKNNNFAFSAVREVILDAHKKAKLRSFDEIIRKEVEMLLADILLNIDDESYVQTLVRLSEVKWVRQLAMDMIDYEVNVWHKRAVEKLMELKEVLAEKNSKT